MTVAQPDHLVVVGASLAGLRAVEEARALGYAGHLTLLGAEPHLPYDRPPLSKEFIDGSSGSDGVQAPHFPGVDELHTVLDVDVRLGDPVAHLDLEARMLTTAGGTEVGYDGLVIATGAAPRSLPGTRELAGVHVLRTLDDAHAIRAALDAGARTVVVGAGFIGSEVAGSARRRDLPVTIVEFLPVPLVRAVGEHAGAALTRLHEQHGTRILVDTAVTEIVGDDHVTGVRLADGTILPADLVVVGVGAAPVTGWLEGSGLRLEDGVVCDATLSAAPGVWAAGDVARWANPDLDVTLRLEHWTNASDMGAHAAANAIDPAGATPYRHIPYFWSDWYGHRIQFAGLAEGTPQVVSGGWDGDAFVALYRRGDRLIGVLTLDRRADIMKYRALIARRATWADGLALAAKRNAARAS